MLPACRLGVFFVLSGGYLGGRMDREFSLCGMPAIAGHVSIGEDVCRIVA
jgi:hypothetical protein